MASVFFVTKKKSKPLKVFNNVTFRFGYISSKRAVSPSKMGFDCIAKLARCIAIMKSEAQKRRCLHVMAKLAESGRCKKRIWIRRLVHLAMHNRDDRHNIIRAVLWICRQSKSSKCKTTIFTSANIRKRRGLSPIAVLTRQDSGSGAASSETVIIDSLGLMCDERL